MKRFVLPLAAVVLALCGQKAQAQVGFRPVQTSGLYAQPTVSPYINLARGGINPAINYYGLVRPQIEAQAGIQQLQQFATSQTYLDNTALLAKPITDTGTSGHFNTSAKYFQTNRTGTSGTPSSTTPSIGLRSN